jgi:hypothetical protein
VIEGYNVVKAIEACGSSSGSTSHDVMIRDCGEGRGPAQPATASAQASGTLPQTHDVYHSNIKDSYCLWTGSVRKPSHEGSCCQVIHDLILPKTSCLTISAFTASIIDRTVVCHR